MATNPRSADKNWTLYLALAVYLILICLWRVLVTADEYARPATIYLNVALNVVALAGLVAMRIQLPQTLPRDDHRQTFLRWLFVPAFAAGVIMLLIRVTSRTGWATGHLFYECCN